jgi:mannose-1-phosphate guanylyltransferase
LERAREVVPEGRIRILTGSHLLEPFRGALGGLDDSTFLVEPQAKGTGPVLIWAAWCVLQEDPEAVLVSLHADHAIHPTDAFLSLIQDGAAVARHTEALFTIAVPPSRPETGYGYIKPGPSIPWEGESEAFRVQEFIEKPDRTKAEEYVAAGYFWNSGIFLWKASVFLEEVRRVAPELFALVHLLEEAKVEEFFERAPSISVDEAILEKSRNVASLTATFQWDDVGAWEALARTRVPDSEGNLLLGKAKAVDSRENIVMVEEGSAVLFGVDGLVVVRSGDLILVADRKRTPDLKSLLEALPPEFRDPDTP